MGKSSRPITLKDLSKHIDKLKLSYSKKEFLKVGLLALIKCELEERMGCKVDI